MRYLVGADPDPGDKVHFVLTANRFVSSQFAFKFDQNGTWEITGRRLVQDISFDFVAVDSHNAASAPHTITIHFR